MMPKFDLLLFIDDDPATNFLHQMVLEESNICKRHIFYDNAEEALTYLSDIKSQDDIPDLIFLDINMPKVNGWEFLDRFNVMQGPKSPVIIILTTSLNPVDKEKADENPLVYRLYNKPMQAEYLEQLAQVFLKP